MAESEKENRISNEKEFLENQSMRGQSYIPREVRCLSRPTRSGLVSDKDER